MKNRIIRKRIISKITLFISAFLLLGLAFHSCDKDDEILNDQTSTLNEKSSALKTTIVPEINLIIPEVDIIAGNDFDITFSSTCGRIMLERGFIAEFDEYGAMISKDYLDLSCDMDNLLWEAVEEDVFEDCQGTTVTQNLVEPGTYVYRVKLNFKAINKSDCFDCGDFKKNQFECFAITVVEGNQNEGTFVDGRDGKEYKWLKIGNQIWMAENLAYMPETGSFVYGDNISNEAIYGRLYTKEASKTAAPEGWHLPSIAEWQTLKSCIESNPEVYGTSIAKALASTTLWFYYGVPNYPYPGSDLHLNNTSGFNALPAGYYTGMLGVYQSETYYAMFWSSDPGSISNDLPNSAGITFNRSDFFFGYSSLIEGLSIRCVKNAE